MEQQQVKCRFNDLSDILIKQIADMAQNIKIKNKRIMKIIYPFPVIDKTDLKVKTLYSNSRAVNFMELLDSKTLIIATSDGYLKEIDTETGECISCIEAHFYGISAFLIFDGKILTGGEDTAIRYWDIKNKKNPLLFCFTESNAKILSLMKFPETENSVLALSGNKEVKIINLPHFDYRQNLILKTEIYAPFEYLGNNRLAFISALNKIGIVNITNYNDHSELSGHESKISLLKQFESSKLISAGGKGDGKIKIWDIENMTCISEIQLNKFYIFDLQFKDKYFICLSADSTLKIIDRENNTIIRSIKCRGRKLLPSLESNEYNAIILSWINEINLWKLNI